jgi:hypothetical protein
MSHSKRVRIVSDGTAGGTKIFDQNGIELKAMITQISWEINATDNIAEATIKLFEVELDVIGDQNDSQMHQRHFSLI